MSPILRFLNMSGSDRREFLLKFMTEEEYLLTPDHDRLSLVIEKMITGKRLPEFRKTLYRYLGTND